jgi:hypothetical protein
VSYTDVPNSAIKGGSAMALRYGRGTRFTQDLDAARVQPLARFRSDFEDSLAAGWAGFSGRLIERAAPRPTGETDDPELLQCLVAHASHLESEFRHYIGALRKHLDGWGEQVMQRSAEVEDGVARSPQPVAGPA